MTLISLTDDPGHTEPPLTALAQLDVEAMGEASKQSVLKHLKDIRAHAEKEFGRENVLTEPEAQELMIGVSALILHTGLAFWLSTLILQHLATNLN